MLYLIEFINAFSQELNSEIVCFKLKSIILNSFIKINFLISNINVVLGYNFNVFFWFNLLLFNPLLYDDIPSKLSDIL